MNALIRKIDEVIAGIGKLGRREAFEALQTTFGIIKESGTLSEQELRRFMDMVTLVLFVYPRGMRIRISGPKQAANAREEVLEFNDTYEAALGRTIEFLMRNFFDHLEEYDPQHYLRAALRALAKEYGRARAIQNETVAVDGLLERVAPDEDGVAASTDSAGRLASEGGLGLSGADADAERPECMQRYESLLDNKPDGTIFYDWFVGNLSRIELAQLHGLSVEQVNETILRVARSGFENGRLFPLVSSLLHLKEDGDILWLALKGLTGEQIGRKVAQTHWVVYKRLEALRRRFARLREMGRPGRDFGEWLCGVRPELSQSAGVRQVLHEHGLEFGLIESDFES